MSDRALTRREEKRLLKAARRVVLQGEFPNPERSGCPGKETLRAIAARKLNLEQVAGWVDHLGFCSPCYAEYDVLRRQVVTRRWIQFGAATAGIVLVVAIGIRAWFGGLRLQRIIGGSEIARRVEPGSYQPFLLDLRNRTVLRGEESVPDESPLELPRGRLSLSIYLPIGSEPGKYEFEIAQESEQPLVRAEGDVAGLRAGIAAFNVKLNLKSLRPGLYLACIRRSGWSWRYYHVVLK
jgi:hypothetical protein